MVLSKLDTGFLPGRIQQWIRLVVVLVALAASAGQAATFNVSLDHDTLLLGDTATLSLRFDGGEPSSGLSIPDVAGLQFLNLNRPNVNRVDLNGQKTLVIGIVIKPTQTGDFTIPSISAKVNGETLASQPVKFKVVEPTAPTPGSEAEQQSLALLRLKLPKEEVFVGETFVFEMQLLLNPGVQRIIGTDLPGLQTPLQLDGCTVGKAIEGQQRQTVIGNTTFTVIPVLIPITAMKTGPVTIGPISGAVVVELPPRGGGPRDLFEQFGFGGFVMNSGPRQRVSVSSHATTLKVLPLPEADKPASFSGAIGSYRMVFSPGQTNVAVGDPITLRVEIAGRGALDAFTLPEQGWKEFKSYPPTAKINLRGDLGLEGTKTFEQVVVPQNAEIKELPAFEFSFFNPETRIYQTLRQEALPIIVRPGGSTAAPTLAAAAGPQASEQTSQDIVHIKPRAGRVSAIPTPWVTQPVFLALQGVPVLALLGAMLWRRRSDSLANNPRLRRQRAVAHTIREGLVQLRKLAAEQNSDAFFATVFRLLQEQIGERLDLPASAITEAVIDDRLRGHGLDPAAADALHELFQQCNQARYAPVQSTQALEAIVPKLESVLSRLQEVKG